MKALIPPLLHKYRKVEDGLDRLNPYRCVTFDPPLFSQAKQLHAIMQHDPTGTPPVVWLRKQGSSLMSAGETPQQNFVKTLPTEMSVKIFGELDPQGLCGASRTCRLWRDVIEESEQLWRRQCLLVRAVCQQEVDSDRRDGLSWKVRYVALFPNTTGSFSTDVSVS